MLTSKLRTSIITAAAALTVLSGGPMTSVASAQPKKKETAHCVLLKALWESDWEKAEANKDDDEIFKSWVEDATYTFELAQSEGCGWATYGVRSPGGPSKETLPTPLPIEEEPKAPTKVTTPPTNQERPSPPPVLAV